MLREEIKAGVASIEIQANGGVSLEQMVAAKIQRLKAHLEAAFALPSTTHEESRLKRIAIKKAALAIADSCDVVVSDAYGVEAVEHKDFVTVRTIDGRQMRVDLTQDAPPKESPPNE